MTLYVIEQISMSVAAMDFEVFYYCLFFAVSHFFVLPAITLDFGPHRISWLLSLYFYLGMHSAFRKVALLRFSRLLYRT